MDTINYRGNNVYTQSNLETSLEDLKRAKTSPVTIEEAYFFTVNGDRQVQRIDFDKKRVEEYKSGLYVTMKNRAGENVCLSIAGLDRIMSFIAETNILGKDLSAIRGKQAISYNIGGIQLVGISPQE